MLWLFNQLSRWCVMLEISLHEIELIHPLEHQLVELWTRRHFQCDCPTGSQDSSDLIVAGPSSKRRKCTLNPPEIQPAEANIENRYGRNFKGEFCRCGRVYNAETEQEAMVVCIGCEVRRLLPVLCCNLFA